MSVKSDSEEQTCMFSILFPCLYKLFVLGLIMVF